ncbi:MAG: hypothetical protein HOQ05_02420, partial [Corynebacteriales bacterium]|nr:hypothetical protein [Mycobacteriales bacterium]
MNDLMPEVGRQREIVAALSRRVIDEELDVAGAVQELTRIPGIGLTELGALGVLQQQIAAQNDASNAL